jgi:phytol kinase
MDQAALIAAALVGTAALAILGLSELLRKLGAGKELSRKAAHLGSGFLACSFPWLFESPITVAVLTGGFASLVILAKRFGQLQGVHGVERESHGAAVFPIVIALLFWLTDGDPLLYCIPILVLTVSDAAAALIGKGYGVKHYKALGEERSLEGSLAFFTVTFVAVHVPLLLSGATPRLESVLIALLIAVLATCIEAISVRGLDNLFIPLLVAFALNNFLDYSEADLVNRCIALIGFGVFAIAIRKLRFVTVTGSIAGFLVLYVCYSLGGLPWVMPIVAAFILFVLLTQMLAKQAPIEPLGLSRIFQAIVVEVAIVFLWHYTGDVALYTAFLAALSGSTALISARLGGQLGAARGLGPSSALFTGILTALLAPAIGYAFLEHDAFRTCAIAVLGGWACLLLLLILRMTTARFHCEKCASQSHEPRHCGEAATLQGGHRYWTSNRAAMVSIALVATLVWTVEQVRIAT